MSVTHELVIDDRGNLKRVPIGQDLAAGQVAIDTSQLERILGQFSSDLGIMMSHLKDSNPQVPASDPQLPSGTPIFESPEVLVDVGVILDSRRLKMSPFSDRTEDFWWNQMRGANTVGFILHNRASLEIEINNQGSMSNRYAIVPGMVPVFGIPENSYAHHYDNVNLEIRIHPDRSWGEDMDFTIVIGKK